MKIFIDGLQADIDERSEVEISLAVASLTTLEKRQTGYSKSIKLPATPRNAGIMGNCGDINTAPSFNKENHTARIEYDGCVIIEGLLCLLGFVTDPGGSEHYSVAIIGPGKEWVNKAAGMPLRSVEIEFSETISAATIMQSWTWDKPVRFLPVQRDDFAVENHNSHLFPPVKVLAFEDYHPFLHVKTIMENVFASAGYSITSDFISGELFNSLYMSGNYPAKSTERITSRMNFRAGRFTDAQATANSLGRVFATPLSSLNTVGNLVDTADPKEESSDGIVLGDVFNTNDCFRKIGDRIAFVPTETVVAGFEFSIHYTADYFMTDREELDTFDTLYLWEGQTRNYKVANRNEDRRNEFRAGKTFIAIIFDHQAADSYQLRYDEVTNELADLDNLTRADVTERTHITFSSRTKSVTVTSVNPVLNPQLWIKPGSSSTYVLCEKDWALYDGHVEQNGQVEVELTVRSSPEKITPGNPKYFDRIYFGGAKQGMGFKLGKYTTVKPLFAGYPCEGSTVGFPDVAAHEISCMDFINAFKHMFNLYFFTDNLSRTVYIEPRGEFYRNDSVVDWSDRIDLLHPIEIEEPGTKLPHIYTLQYQTGDGAVTRHNMTNSEKFGSYSWENSSVLISGSESTYINPVFTASINSTGDYPDATSASLVQAGNQYSDDSGYAETLNFPAKIVRYRGMMELPGSQRWGWPSHQSAYPFLAFHNNTDTGDGFTLCFEDRDESEGLHRYYDRNFELSDQSKRVTLHLRLNADDIEPFTSPNALGKDFRALFRLKIDEENALYRMEEICDYNPLDASTKCVFIKEI